MANTIEKWKQLDQRRVYKARVFELVSNRMQSPDGKIEDDFYYLDCPDWIDIVAVTENNEVVLERQFRHGTQNISLEVPAGIVEAGELPALTAVRELEEETGYTAAEVHYLGWLHPNPAIMNNRCHFYYAENAKKTNSQNLDLHEDIAVELVRFEDMPRLIAEGQITHALSHNALMLAWAWRQRAVC